MAAPTLLSFPRHLVPRDIALQIASYLRIQWPFLENKSGKIWDESPSKVAGQCFVLMDGDALISHAQANQREIEFAGQKLVCGGLSAVFTYPAWRGSGLAKDVVRAATQHIRESGSDVAMLFCGPRLRNFYTECGWEAVDTAQILYGDPVSPTLKNDNLIMMMFVSETGTQLKPRISSEPVYVGEQTW